jgi:hypothetical protein
MRFLRDAFRRGLSRLVGVQDQPPDDSADVQLTSHTINPPMTEADWLDCATPAWMLDTIQTRASDRKLRLFCCECVRRLWPALWDEHSKRSVETAERYADGQAGEQDLISVHSTSAINPLGRDPKLGCAAWAAHAVSEKTITIELAILISSNSANGNPDNIEVAEYIWQCRLLGEIFGNPFRPVTLDSSWLTPNVTDLAQKIYTDRTFDQMPFLADSLVKSGCANQDILNHCRGSGPHVRGCWALDLVLGKE